MNRLLSVLTIIFFLMSVSSCSQVTEITKTLWGSSTRALEEARQEAISKTYQCSYAECFEAVLRLGQTFAKSEEEKALLEKEPKKDEASSKPAVPGMVPIDQKGSLIIFIQNKEKGHIVFVGIPGSVNTTEVGVFFVPGKDNTVRLEISSLSTNAKKKTAELIFAELDKQFKEVPKAPNP